MGGDPLTQAGYTDVDFREFPLVADQCGGQQVVVR